MLYYLDNHFFWGLQQTTWISFEDLVEKLCSFPQALSVTTVDLNTIIYLTPQTFSISLLCGQVDQDGVEDHCLSLCLFFPRSFIVCLFNLDIGGNKLIERLLLEEELVSLHDILLFLIII